MVRMTLREIDNLNLILILYFNHDGKYSLSFSSEERKYSQLLTIRKERKRPDSLTNVCVFMVSRVKTGMT
jgi:hypothetical protein